MYRDVDDILDSQSASGYWKIARDPAQSPRLPKAKVSVPNRRDFDCKSILYNAKLQDAS